MRIAMKTSNKRPSGHREAERPWMRSFGKLRALHEETVRIDRIIEQEFRQIERHDVIGDAR